jgi:uncharacterized protein (TIGR03435 family)
MKIRNRIVSALILVFVASGVALGKAQQPAPTQAQAPQSKLAFDVATIKPAAPLDMQRIAQTGQMPKIGPQIGATRASYYYMSLTELIAMAWTVRPYQISGPDWLGKERFDIEATMPEGSKKDDASSMLQSLLEERFKLAVHRAQEERKVLALEVGHSGPKMKESATPPQAFDPDSPLQPGERQIEGLDGPMRMKMNQDGSSIINMGAKGTITQKFDRQTMSLHLQSSGITMAGYVEMLSNLFLQLGGASSRQVVDETGLKGYYEMDVEISVADIMALARAAGVDVPTAPPSGGAASANAPPTASTPEPTAGVTVMDSVERMGLKLENTKATVDRLVVDHVEKAPTEN